MKKFAQTALLSLALATGANVVTSQEASSQSPNNDNIPPATYAPAVVDAEYEVEARPERPTPPAPLRHNANARERRLHEAAMAEFQEAEDAYYEAVTPEMLLTIVPESDRWAEMLRELLISKLPELSMEGIRTLHLQSWLAYLELSDAFISHGHEMSDMMSIFERMNFQQFREIENEAARTASEVVAHLPQGEPDTLKLWNEVFIETRDNNEWVKSFLNALNIFIEVRTLAFEQGNEFATRSNELRVQPPQGQAQNIPSHPSSTQHPQGLTEEQLLRLLQDPNISDTARRVFELRLEELRRSENELQAQR
ncbi:MAG: hypothetical protein FWC16_05100 [Defluviitaleaceae bacterium]|nr:hypothetical protein [Defluviitaleaceae bacterium]MCL2274284.1 hypothetical protein [Defluviitaleaceae bacterium]